MNNVEKVAVYGTLRPRKGGRYVEATHEIIGFKMYNYGNFPYITPSYGDWAHADTVKVNIIEADAKKLAQLDEYEGVSQGLYRRELVDAFNLETGEDVEVWVYVGDNIVPEHVLSGDWADV